MLDKWERSRLAVECGMDLVLELPFVYACSSAEFFAKGAVEIFSRLGCITHLAFGAEERDLDRLRRIADTAEAEGELWQREIRQAMDKGISYGKAREDALDRLLGAEYRAAVKSPNNILAVEYLKQLIRQKADIEPLLIQRKGAGYYDKAPEGGFASASAIREHLDREQRAEYVPEITAKALETAPDIAAVSSSFFDLARGKILSAKPEELAEILSVGEGLENKLKKEIRMASSASELIERTASRRYPENRIRRILCHISAGLTKDDFRKIQSEDCLYGRVLAFNRKGASLLKQIKKQELASIPIITNINKFSEKEPEKNPMLRCDIIASDLYNLITARDLYKYSDYVKQPYRSIAEK